MHKEDTAILENYMPECPNCGAVLDKEIKFSFSKIIIAALEQIDSNLYCCNNPLC
jgi:hypothetical protein